MRSLSQFYCVSFMGRIIIKQLNIVYKAARNNAFKYYPVVALLPHAQPGPGVEQGPLQLHPQ